MSERIFDIAIIGAGPAGLSAALTARVRNKSVVLFERGEFSEKLQKAHIVDNYIGMPQVTGKGLMQQFVSHCLAYNPEIVKGKVTNVYPSENKFTLLTAENSYTAKTLIIASGVVPTILLEGEKKFLGQGVSYCATCDGMLYRGKDVAIISYTEEGEHEAEFLAELCRTVYYMPQYETSLKNTRSNLKIVSNVKAKSIIGDVQVTGLSTEQEDINVHGVFILRQSDPAEVLLPEIELDGEVIKVDRHMATNIPGVFAAGDCTGKPWQIAKATGEGLVAALSAIARLDQQRLNR